MFKITGSQIQLVTFAGDSDIRGKDHLSGMGRGRVINTFQHYKIYFFKYLDIYAIGFGADFLLHGIIYICVYLFVSYRNEGTFSDKVILGNMLQFKTYHRETPSKMLCYIVLTMPPHNYVTPIY